MSLRYLAQFLAHLLIPLHLNIIDWKAVTLGVRYLRLHCLYRLAMTQNTVEDEVVCQDLT